MKFFSSGFLFLLLVVFFTQPSQAQQAAFPGAEGHGMYTSGGRGGKVIKVTNLNDSGEGSLRAAIEASGPRIVVFEVSGTIALESRLNIQKDDITIAGQTAPGDGICVRNYSVYLTASNVIIRYMRFRLGDEAQQVDDAMGGKGSKNVIIDHCSMSWSIDECASFKANEDFTLQWCLLTESLGNSYHSGSHGFGGIWGGNRASFHHNLLAHHSNRNPRFHGLKLNGPTDAELVDMRNNVIYNCGDISHGSEGGGSYNMVNNYYKYGPASGDIDNSFLKVSPATAEYNWLELEGAHGVFYIKGNYFYGNEAFTSDNWDGGVEWGIGTSLERVKGELEFDRGNIRTDDAETAYQRVLEYVGASLSRDTVDKRAIHDARTGTATVMDGGNGSTNGYIDTQEAVGGWPVLNSIPPPADTDGDGMPDEWEFVHGLDPNNPADGNEDRDYDLYTNIEEYINSLALGYFDTDPYINTVQPQENQIFITHADTSIDVEAYSKDYNGGSVVKMELYMDDELILENNDSAKIITTLENVSSGRHSIIVRTTDDSANVSVDTTTVFVGTQEVRIDVEESSNGRVILEPMGGFYTEGVDVTITAIPDEGYNFHGWIKDIESSNNKLQITTAKDLSLKPVFAKDSEKKNIWHHPVKINFQPEEDYEVPEGYIADYGGALSEKWHGYTYGWMEGYQPFNGLNLGESGVWKTFRYFEYSGNAKSWGIDLPGGIYRIRLGLGGKLFRGWAVETELKIDIEGILVEDPDGVDLLDEHILDGIPVLDGQLTLTSVEESRICFLEIELLELVAPRTLTVENGRGAGEYYPDLEEEILVIADTPPEGQVFDNWTGDTTYLEDVDASATFVSMPDADISLSATYRNMEQDTAHYLIVFDGSGSGYYAAGTQVDISAPDTLGGGTFSHWEYDCPKTVSFDDGSNPITVSMPEANIVFEAVYEMPAPGEGDIYQAEEAFWDETSIAERYHSGYFGTGYVNFRKDRGSYLQFNNIEGKEGGKFTIKVRYSLNDEAREGVVTINGIRDTIVMTETNSWSEWDELEVTGILESGSNNTIRIETTGDDLGYIDQIELIKLNTTGLETSPKESGMNVRCYPNPFTDEASISFELEEPSEVHIQLYDLQGHRLSTTQRGLFPAGINEVKLRRNTIKPGLYILKVTSNHSERNIKIIKN